MDPKEELFFLLAESTKAVQKIDRIPLLKEIIKKLLGEFSKMPPANQNVVKELEEYDQNLDGISKIESGELKEKKLGEIEDFLTKTESIAYLTGELQNEITERKITRDEVRELMEQRISGVTYKNVISLLLKHAYNAWKSNDKPICLTIIRSTKSLGYCLLISKSKELKDLEIFIKLISEPCENKAINLLYGFQGNKEFKIIKEKEKYSYLSILLNNIDLIKNIKIIHMNEKELEPYLKEGWKEYDCYIGFLLNKIIGLPTFKIYTPGLNEQDKRRLRNCIEKLIK